MGQQRYGIVIGDEVANVVIAEPDYAAERGWVPLPDEAGIGWLWINGILAPPIEPSAPVPPRITMRQARLALLFGGMLDQVDAAIDNLPSPLREAAHIEWEYAADVWRNSALIAQLGQALGLDDAGIDALFIQAADL